MTLRHHNKSKWAKNILQRGHKDPAARQALTEQQQLGRELKRKIRINTDEDNDSDGQSSEDVYSESSPSEDEGQPVEQEIRGQGNPWLAGESRGQVQERKKMKRKRQRKETMENFRAKKIPAYQVEDDSLLLLNDSKDKENEENSEEDEEDNRENDESEEESPEEESESKDETNRNPEMKDLGRSDDTADKLEEEESEDAQRETVPNAERQTDTVSVANLDPSKVISVIEGFGRDEEGDEMGGMLGQRSHIAEAFANDDVVAEFVKDKEQVGK